MAPKTIRTKHGKLMMKSILLQNGNLLIPSRAEHDRDELTWKEVQPGSSDFKRWLPVSVQEPDPR